MVPKVGASAFTAASRVHPDLRLWNPAAGSPDADIIPDLDAMRSRSRDLVRNHGVAQGALQTQLDNILGTGLWLTPTPDYLVLGRDRKWAMEWRKPIKALWRTWFETKWADAGESLTGDGLAQQIFTGAWVNGDALALPLWLPTPGAPASTRIQVVEGDRLSNPDFKLDSDTLRGGVEVNEYGAPLAYWIRKNHPGDMLYGLSGILAVVAGKWERIPAKTDFGRLRVIHAHDKGRAGQTRGVPALAAIMKEFKVLQDYRAAELKCAAVNGMIALVTESALGQGEIAELLSSNADALDNYQKGLSERNRSAIPFREGLAVPLMLGEKLSAFTPTRPASAFEPFTTALFRHMATGLNIPYELLLKDFSKTNYSSARAALLEAWRFFTGRRNWLSLQFYQPVYELFLEEMASARKIDLPLADFYANRTAWSSARWIGPGRGWVDPLKEAEAAQLRMGIFVSTLEDECAEQGKDWEEVLEQIAEEESRLKELGLTRQQVQKAASSQASDPSTDENMSQISQPDARRERA